MTLTLPYPSPGGPPTLPYFLQCVLLYTSTLLFIIRAGDMGSCSTPFHNGTPGGNRPSPVRLIPGGNRSSPVRLIPMGARFVL